MKKLILSLLVLVLLCALASPLQVLGLLDSPDKDTVCNPKTIEEIKDCPNWQKMFFQPNSFGNVQLPLVVIAGFCDTSKPVFFNEGGCVKTPLQELVQPKVKAKDKK